ncbi:anti-sigma-F factor Fin family protein [Alkalicoccobacillus porphyridii]|uniref:Anti-sigma-F factor Fin family protein n=1 Tax=Alkalicoccobacillus porphyridii TaxID=2597270 RepID=A0A553ZUA0_9BACI|nr:anti-sigma-F factor Fin family protein [Alkalicoccobacillus porphyridii]TSB45060.1 anti-sigma-F factor Fin family protein [Alkalicoccobacillus porphyridii]
MTVYYHCRHCQLPLGMLTHSVQANELGIHHLESDHREEVLTYMENGDIHVRAICEDCQEALASNPTLHELDHFIQ